MLCCVCAVRAGVCTFHFDRNRRWSGECACTFCRRCCTHCINTASVQSDVGDGELHVHIRLIGAKRARKHVRTSITASVLLRRHIHTHTHFINVSARLKIDFNGAHAAYTEPGTFSRWWCFFSLPASARRVCTQACMQNTPPALPYKHTSSRRSSARRSVRTLHHIHV